MRKIVHFLPDNHAWGGIEVYLQHTLAMLQQRANYQVVAAVTKGGRLAKQLKENGIEVRELPVHLKIPLVRALDLRTLRSLLSVLREEQADLVHIHKGRVEQSLIRMAGFPMVYTYHSYGGPNNLENAPNALLRNLYACTRPLLRGLTPYLSGMLVVSQYERERLYREGFLPDDFRAEVLHNGLPVRSMLDKVQNVDRLQVRQSLGLSLEMAKEARVIVFPCRVTTDKNAGAFLRIAKRVLEDPRRQKPVYFVAAGDGALAATFEDAFVNDPVLSQHGCYLGFREDILQLIRAADLTVSTSLQEGFGLRVLESLLLGKPCVTYAAGGISEVMALPEAKNWLVPSGDEEAFVAALIDAIHTPDEELARLAPVLEAYGKRFDIENHVQLLEKFYGRVFDQLAKPSIQPGALAGQLGAI